jgi:hypothetical protein
MGTKLPYSVEQKAVRDSLEYSDRIKSYQQAEFSAWDNFWLPFKLVASVVGTIACFVAALYLLVN